MTDTDFHYVFLAGLLAGPFVEAVYQIATPGMRSVLRWTGLVVICVMAAVAASDWTLVGQSADAVLLACGTAFVVAILWRCIRIRSRPLRWIAMAGLLMLLLPIAALTFVTAAFESVGWDFIRRSSLDSQLAYTVQFHGDVPTRAGYYFVDFVRIHPWCPFLERQCGHEAVIAIGEQPESLVIALVASEAHDAAEIRLAGSTRAVIRLD
jgi:hypothetical protein